MSTVETAVRYWAIKVRPHGAKQWTFLTPEGQGCRLRIYAAMLADKAKAERIAAEIRDQNEGYDAKVVLFSKQ